MFHRWAPHAREPYRSLDGNMAGLRKVRSMSSTILQPAYSVHPIGKIQLRFIVTNSESFLVNGQNWLSAIKCSQTAQQANSCGMALIARLHRLRLNACRQRSCRLQCSMACLVSCDSHQQLHPALHFALRSTGIYRLRLACVTGLLCKARRLPVRPTLACTSQSISKTIEQTQ